MKQKELNSKKYAIRKEYLKNPKIGGELIVCKLKTIKFSKGIPTLVYTEVGNSKNVFTDETHTIFSSIEEAMAIMSGKEYQPEIEDPGVNNNTVLRRLEIEAMRILLKDRHTLETKTMEEIGVLVKQLAKEVYNNGN